MTDNVLTFDTQQSTVFDRMFQNCRNITNLNISNFKMSDVTTVKSMFNNCSKLTRLSLPTNVTFASESTIESMFEECSSIQSLNISGLNTKNVIIFRTVFHNCSTLNELIFSPNFIATNGTDFSGMFYGCNGFQELDLKNFDMPKASIIVNMFAECTNLSTLTLPTTFTTASNTMAHYMFYRCTNLKNIINTNFMAGITTASSMFSNCSSLTELSLQSLISTNEKPITMNSMFSGCTSLKRITFAQEFIIPASAVNVFQDCNVLAFVNIGNRTDENDISAFINKLTSDILGSNWIYISPNIARLLQLTPYCSTSGDTTTIDTTAISNDGVLGDCSNAFLDQSAVTTINNLSVLNTTYVTSFSGMFKRCGVTSLNPINLDTSNAETMDSMFAQMSALNSVTVGSNFTAGDCTNFNNMFYESTGLQSVNLNSINATKVNSASGMFSGCVNLTNLTMPTKLKFVGSANLSYMFSSCQQILDLNLTCIDVSDATSLNINSMFSGCTVLKTIEFHSSFIIPAGASSVFFNCKALYKVTIGQGRTPTEIEDFKSALNASLPDKDWIYDSTNGWLISGIRLEEPYYTINPTTGVATLDIDLINSSGIVVDCTRSFENTGVKSIKDANDLDTSSVGSFAYMFSGCRSLTQIVS